MISGILLVEKGNFFKESTDGITLNEDQFIKYYADINAVLPIEKEDYFALLKTETDEIEILMKEYIKAYSAW